MKKNVTNEGLRLIGNEAQMSMKPSAMMMRAASACGSGSGCGCGSGSGCGCGCGYGSGCGSGCGCGSGDEPDKDFNANDKSVFFCSEYKIEISTTIAYTLDTNTSSAKNINIHCNVVSGVGYIKGKKYTVDNAGATASISEASGSIQKSFEFNIFVNVEDAGSKKIKANVSISNDIGNKFIQVSQVQLAGFNL